MPRVCTVDDSVIPETHDAHERETTVDARLSRVVEDVIRRRGVREIVHDADVIAAHPELMPALGRKLRALRAVESAERRAASGSSRHATEDAFDNTPHAAPDRLPANAIAGYELLREIHRGGQGVVYEAAQQATGRSVAVKVMRDGPFLGPRDKARFDREVRVLAQLRHPNIVTIHDSGQAAGSHYFVMDYIAGEPLDVFLAERDLSINQVLVLFTKICAAVNAAHLRGVIHRDLKPGNILIDADGEPHVLDFGLAKIATEELDDSDQRRGMTLTGQFVGSLPWASPEQAGGVPSGIDIRTDVYSLGVILFHLLTNRFPYVVVGNMRDVLDNILKSEPARPSVIGWRGRSRPRIDDELETIVLKCLSKERERRYQTAGELGRDIAHYLSGEPIEAKRDSGWYVLRKNLRRNRLPLAVATGFVLLLMASSVVAWMLYVKADRATRRATENLWDSYVVQARAGRMTGRPGQRFDSLDALTKAAAIRPSIEVRNEAIACLALPDLRIVERIDTGFASVHDMECAFSGRGDRYWLKDLSHGRTTVRRFADNETLLTLPDVPSGDYRRDPRFSRDGRYLARGVGVQCEVWDIDKGELIKAIPADVSHRHDPYDFHPDGREIAVGCEDGSIRIHSLASDDARILNALHKPVHEVRYCPAGDLLATASITSEDHSVLIRDASAGELLHTLEHPSAVLSIAWSPDGSRIASGCEDTNLYVWNAETGRLQYTLREHQSTVVPVGFDPTGNWLFSADWSGVSRLWDARTGDPLLVMQGAGRAFTADPDRFIFRSHTDGVTLATAELVQSDCLISLVGRAVELPRDSARELSTSPDGRWITSASEAGVRFWDATRGRQIAFLPTGSSLRAVFGPDGSELVTVSRGSKGVLRWPLRIERDTLHIGPPRAIVRQLPGRTTAIRRSTDSRYLVVAVNDQGRVLVIDLERPGEPRSIGPHPNVRYLSISPNDRWLATGSWRGKDVRIWDLASGELVHEIPYDRDANVGFSPDGKWLVTSEVELTLWRTGTWEAAARLPVEGITGTSGPIAFSPNGRLLALSPMRPWITLVDLEKLEVVARLWCPGQAVFDSLIFTPDGTRLVFPDPQAGHIVYVWDLRALRTQLAALDLDWDLPPYPLVPAADAPEPLRVELDLGALAQ